MSKLFLMDFPFPPEFGENGPWWFAFQQVPGLPENELEVKERSWFLKGLAHNPSAITEEDIAVYANHTSSPDGLRAGFEYFRAFLQDAEQHKESAKSKITMPVLVLGGDIYPALGGDFPGNTGLSSTQTLAAIVTGVIVSLSEHWMPEEQPKFVIE